MRCRCCHQPQVRENANFRVEVKRSRKAGANPPIVVLAKARARGDRLAQKLEQTEQELAIMAKQLESVRGSNLVMEEELLELARELDLVKALNSEIEKKPVRRKRKLESSRRC